MRRKNDVLDKISDLDAEIGRLKEHNEQTRNTLQEEMTFKMKEYESLT